MIGFRPSLHIPITFSGYYTICSHMKEVTYSLTSQTHVTNPSYCGSLSVSKHSALGLVIGLACETRKAIMVNECKCCITHQQNFILHADGGPDYAHEATGFPTWHRLFLLWFEREMQHFLNDDNFTVHYWDWRDPDQRTSLFESNRLGAHHPQNSTVTGDLVNGWRTICWYNGSGGVSRPSANQNICDPRNDTGPIQRCPDKERCAANYTGWPTYQDVQDAVNMTQYDMPDYNAFSTGFRNYMEGFLVVGQCDNETDRGRDLCNNKIIDGTKEKVQRLLHNTVSCELCVVNN